ncbi:MAG TPA: vWA domain-containing protein [Cyclobacteriaceae bacterium]|nr:vWA domain-containing protein [Cyclobacteriaceae bacterium]
MDTQMTRSRIFSKMLAFTLLILFITSCEARSASTARAEKPGDGNEQRIMLALLLDTSNSMDGLIDQAKSQLWRIVNELASAKCQDGARPSIQIALYEYGNDGLPSSEGYIRLVSPLTNDLDVISEKLFALKTNGGEEYCGQVIKVSLAQLAWSSSEADLKMIFIAGNEPFTQGEIPYQSACALAKEKDVVVNTIFCGGFDEGVGTSWKRGADLTGGTYMSIEQDRKTVYIQTPYDEKISALNDKLNDTYVYYGKSGSSKKELQMNQDVNAERYGSANKVERAVSKSSHAYSNSTWDLVDAAKDDEKVITRTDEAYLPEAMKGMNETQRKAYVQTKAKERSTIQAEIQVLNEKRKQYIATQAKPTDKETLDAVMINAIKTRAKTKKLSF